MWNFVSSMVEREESMVILKASVQKRHTFLLTTHCLGQNPQVGDIESLCLAVNMVLPVVIKFITPGMSELGDNRFFLRGVDGWE